VNFQAINHSLQGGKQISKSSEMQSTVVILLAMTKSLPRCKML